MGGLPPTAQEQSIATFFSSALAAIGGNSAGPGMFLVVYVVATVLFFWPLRVAMLLL